MQPQHQVMFDSHFVRFGDTETWKLEQKSDRRLQHESINKVRDELKDSSLASYLSSRGQQFGDAEKRA